MFVDLCKFAEMGVLPEIGKAVDEMDWTLPTDVQAEAIPLILGGGDVLMAAETGSGKTGAFCLPVLQIVWETMKDIQSGKAKSSGAKHGNSTSSKLARPASIFSAYKTWLLNMYDRGDSMAITPDGLLCQSRDQKGWHGARATKGVTGKGKYYYEVTVTDDGLCRIGWSTLNASLNLGTDGEGFGYGGTGKKSFQNKFDDFGEAFGLNDTIGCLLDLDKNQILFSRNACRRLKNAEVKFNFGSEPFVQEAPAGYVSLCDAPKEFTVDSHIHGGSGAQGRLKPKPNEPMCLIIEPSRELAEQTDAQMAKFKKYLENPVVRNLVIVGGVAAKDQVAALNSGVEIVTATPGRLEEFISTGQLSLSHVRFFILDEADGLLQQGYERFVDKLHMQIPKVTPDGKRLQMIVCSATLHSMEVKKMAVRYRYTQVTVVYSLDVFQDRLMHFPQWVDLKGQDSVPETVHHVVVMVDPRNDKRWINLRSHIRTDGIHAGDEIRPGSNTPETLSEAVKRLKGEYALQAIRQNKIDRCLIFCRTKLDCDNMEEWLNRCGKGQYSCVCLHSDRRPDERKRNLHLFKENKVRFLICTDVAARGIDVTGIPFVINVTLPDEKSNYLHRIGRVGRAERMGLAISLVSAVGEKVWYHSCPSRGKSCHNARLTNQGGCAIWYNEKQLLGDIEEHLGVSIQQVDSEIKVPADEFDGKVVYGQKRKQTGSGYKGHVSDLAAAVSELSQLEKSAQYMYHHIRTSPLKL
ncbi:ATP dependent RNA helicase Ddx1 [Trichuris trichiura]|uniref:ATP-dependent RNA helicase n=1 Tax=Trichuris trichiura TaxID=36087 RepID=A0A077Z1W5_TRITR|nr:ATP dependent RNA helicase Ddx1 [Trichuris trichiura]